MTAVPQYAWTDATGTITSLMNSSEFVVLREGVHGFADVTDERSLMSVANQTGERFTNTAGKAREFGFDVMIIGSTHADPEFVGTVRRYVSRTRCGCFRPRKTA